MDAHDIGRSAHGCRSHSFKNTNHVGVLKLHVGGETAEPDLAGTTHDELERGRSDTSSLAGVLDNQSEIAGRRTSDVQLCESDRFALPWMISAYLLSWSERTSSRYPRGAAGTGRKNRRSLD